MNAVDRRHAQVLQSGRGGADDDDLAGEFVGRARAPGAVEVLVEIAVGNARETVRRAAPRQHDIVGVGHAIAEVCGHARGQRGHLPAVDHLAQEVAAPDAVLIGRKADQAGAPVLARQDQRRQEAGAGLRIRAGLLADPEVASELGDQHAVRGGLQRQLEQREIGVGVLGDGFGERRIVLAAKIVGLGERDIEDDGAGPLRRQAFHQLGMHDARPRPAPRVLFHAREALLVDVDEHDIGVGHELGGLHAHEPVEKAMLERPQGVQRKELERGEGQRGESERRQRDFQSPRRFQISAESVAWLRV